MDLLVQSDPLTAPPDGRRLGPKARTGGASSPELGTQPGMVKRPPDG